ncbi:hypothetical protein [Microbacterium sp. ZW T5_56]|uniref:hypothetical protein n=1 Tax=Microbacterium sp. ZW T5_56 TaxID=3378081 RepID=UPI00385342D3
MRVHVHSAGRSGDRAWPSAAPDATFIAVRSDVPATDAAAEITKAADPIAPDAVFAHSYLAIPAVLAARMTPAARLVLVEPAFYDIARGSRDVDAHVATVERARAHLATGDLRGYWSIIRPLMFGGPSEAATWLEEQPLAAEFAQRTLPWGHGLRADDLAAERTLVVTGGWNDEYETIAARLLDEGATHVVLPGHGHRAQDHPQFAEVAEAFLAG